ncbi:lysophospholipid acyltransferase family protein [Aestuariibius sp. 2305UL40-4]|uniref:lysophospholipid acyltransferase family protein n=1 Tax=Aestuariibius violaceus TaxID=3234132 RepID=UPI00345E4725
MGQFRQDEGGAAHWLTDRAARSLIWTAKRLPYATRTTLLDTTLRHVLGPMAGFRRRALDHLAYIYPDRPEAERREIADAALGNAGRTLIENYSHKGLRAQAGAAPITGDGLPAIEQARAENRPVIFVTGHFGNYEAPRHALDAKGFTIGGLYRPMANPFFNAHYARTMERVSGPVFEQGRRGTAGFVKHLRDGGMATLFFDIWSREGAVINFLGQPAPTSLSAAEMALKYDALMVPYFGIRQPDGLSFEIAVEAPIARTDPVAMMEEATRRLEARIATHPGQWFWFHRRWKPHRKL